MMATIRRLGWFIRLSVLKHFICIVSEILYCLFVLCVFLKQILLGLSLEFFDFDCLVLNSDLSHGLHYKQTGHYLITLLCLEPLISL